MSEELAVTAQEAPASTTTEPETVQTEQDTPQAEESTPNEPSEVDKLKAAYEKRISRITAARREEERQKLQYAKELEAYRQPKPDEGPKEADYQTVEEYHEARGAWKKEQELLKERAEATEKQKRESLERENQKWVQSIREKEAEFRSKFPDYDEAVEVVNEAVSLANKQHPAFLAFADAMRTSDDTLALTRYLGQNPDELEKMFSMNPAQIYRAITRIENKLATPPETEDEVKQVPTPPRPIGGTGKVAKPLDKMSSAELLKWVRK